MQAYHYAVQLNHISFYSVNAINKCNRIHLNSQVNDGYFVHFLAPSSLPPLSKYAVFVLDTSGSMMGRKIVQLRNAMEAILSDLNPNDYFSIVEFNSDVKVK